MSKIICVNKLINLFLKADLQTHAAAKAKKWRLRLRNTDCVYNYIVTISVAKPVGAVLFRVELEEFESASGPPKKRKYLMLSKSHATLL